ncbi:hypothetical protein [Streptacidiphilus jiangxiensis]|uniref:Peptidase family M41 n=1 Tax=Streptacidiphilus jiangxiensis TaxID=235985 RepID=A0A1H8B8H1_STRJI|nr:hypothetical protein [Streptacidiphilus jiangxiensis]SEM79093.1 hypothetical protein SAMN05414137_15911 [Streptacidiphilus jiangxiensis]
MSSPTPHWVEIETPSTGTVVSGSSRHPAPEPFCCVGGALDLPAHIARAASAHHEAGHAVLALALGVHIPAVSIGTEAGLSACGHQRGFGGANEGVRDQLVHARLGSALVVLAAGVRAELMWLRENGVDLPATRAWAVEVGGLGDQVIADWLLSLYGHRLEHGTGHDLYDYWQHEAVADAALAAAWGKVGVVAAALLERDRITGDEAAALIGLTNPPAAPVPR